MEKHAGGGLESKAGFSFGGRGGGVIRERRDDGSRREVDGGKGKEIGDRGVGRSEENGKGTEKLLARKIEGWWMD